jgi:hypothetical protein
MSIWVVVGLLAIIAVGMGLLLLLRHVIIRNRRHDASKIAATAAFEGERFQLCHVPTSAGTYLAYLRYEIEFSRHRDDYGLRCQVEGRTGGEKAFARDLGILGPITNRTSLDHVEVVLTQFNTTQVSDNGGYRRSATVLLGSFEPCTAGTELTLTGVVTTVASSRIGSLEAYLVPDTARL